MGDVEEAPADRETLEDAFVSTRLGKGATARILLDWVLLNSLLASNWKNVDLTSLEKTFRQKHPSLEPFVDAHYERT